MSVDIPGWVFPSLILFFLISSFGFYYAVKHYGNKLRIVRFVKRNSIQLTLTLLIFIALFIAIAPIVIIPVPYGHSGVVWKRFSGGTDMDRVVDEGSMLVMPWNMAYIYTTQYQTISHEFEAVTKNGLATKVYVVVRFRVLRDTLPYLHVNVGEDYIDRMLLPEIGSWARLVIAQHSAEQVYSSRRLEVQKEIFDLIKGQVDTLVSYDERSCELSKGANSYEHEYCTVKDYFEIQDFLIHSIELPQGIKDAIVRKIEQAHLVEEYQWRINVAEKEAIRKEKEAEGIAKFQNIVTDGISPTYLRWRGIEATLELAQSNNAKVVVIGGGKDGLPIILNTESSLNTERSLNSNAVKVEQEYTEFDSPLSVGSNSIKKEEYIINSSSKSCSGDCEINDITRNITKH